MKYFKKTLFFLVVLTIAGCARFKLAVINAPVTFSDLKITRDVAYGARDHQKLDIYTPPGSQNSPVIVFFYGGRWTEGRKEDYAFVAQNLANRGYIVVVPDYIKYPEVKFPAFVEDAAKALVWVHRHIGEHKGNVERIYLMGHSAGAHIAALLISDIRYLKAENDNPSFVRAFAGLAGPYDFTPDEPDLMDMFGPPENYPQMQVTTFITGKEPPMLLVRGTDDGLVGASNIEKLSGRILGKGGDVKVISYPGMDHVWAIGAFSWAGKGKWSIADDVDAFFKSY